MLFANANECCLFRSFWLRHLDWFVIMPWIRDIFRPDVEVVVAGPSTVSSPATTNEKAAEEMQWQNPESETVTLGSDLFRVSNDEALLRTLAKEVNLATSTEHYVRGNLTDTFNQRLKMEASIRPLKVAMTENRLFESEWSLAKPAWSSAFMSDNMTSEVPSAWTMLLATLGEQPKSPFNTSVLSYGGSLLSADSRPDRLVVRLASVAIAAEFLVDGTSKEFTIRSSIPALSLNLAMFPGFITCMEREMLGYPIIPAYLASDQTNQPRRFHHLVFDRWRNADSCNRCNFISATSLPVLASNERGERCSKGSGSDAVYWNCSSAVGSSRRSSKTDWSWATA